MCPDRKRLSNNLFASEAPLQRITRRYFHNPHPSFFRFEHEDFLEGRPTRVRDGAGEMAVLEHVLDPEIFSGDESVSVDVVPGRLVGVILTLAGDLEVLFGRLLGRFATAIRASLSPCGFALRPPQSLLCFLQTARVLDRAAVGVRHEVSKAHVQSDCIALALWWRLPHVADNQDVPMPIGSENEVSGLGGSFQRTVLFDLQASAQFARDVKPFRLGVEEHVPPPTVLAKLYGVPAVGTLEAWETNFAPVLLAIKEAFEGFVEPVCKGLHGRLWNVLAASSLETVRQIVAINELASFLVMSLDQFEHLVVNVATLGQTGEEQSVLGAVGEEPVLEGLVHFLYFATLGTPSAAIDQSAIVDSPLAIFR